MCNFYHNFDEKQTYAELAPLVDTANWNTMNYTSLFVRAVRFVVVIFLVTSDCTTALAHYQYDQTHDHHTTLQPEQLSKIRSLIQDSMLLENPVDQAQDSRIRYKEDMTTFLSRLEEIETRENLHIQLFYKDSLILWSQAPAVEYRNTNINDWQVVHQDSLFTCRVAAHNSFSEETLRKRLFSVDNYLLLHLLILLVAFVAARGQSRPQIGYLLYLVAIAGLVFVERNSELSPLIYHFGWSTWLFTGSLYIHRMRSPSNLHTYIQPSLVELFSRLLILSYYGATLVHFEKIIISSEPSLRFDNIFYFDTATFSYLGHFSLILLGFFLFSFRMAVLIQQQLVSRRWRVVSPVLSAAIISLFIHLYSDHINLYIFFIAALAFLFAADLLLEYRVKMPTALISWFMLITGISSGLIYRFTIQLQAKDLKEAVIKLGNPVDSSLVASINEVSNLDCNQPNSENLLLPAYAARYYRLDSIGSDIAYNSLSRQVVPLDSCYCYFSLQQKSWRLSDEKAPFRGIPDLFELGITYYVNNRVVMGDGNIPRPREELIEDSPIGLVQQTGNKRGLELFLRPSSESLLVVSRPSERFKFLSLFACIFMSLFIFTLPLSLVNQRLRLLSPTFHIPFSSSFNLRSRIQLNIFFLILISFIMVAVITFQYFNDLTNKQLREEEIRGVQQLARTFDRIYDRGPIDFSELGRISQEQFKRPILLFDENGQIQYYVTPGSPSRIPYSVFRSFRWNLRSVNTMGNYRYYPLDNKLGSTKAYLGLRVGPDREKRAQLYDIMGSLFSSYAFFLLAAGVLALYVGDSITNPLSKISARLRSLNLLENRPIEYQSNDEIGLLVRAYNRAVRELAYSAEQLKQQEREGAWREMARQVAHEIKNPLTPMRLSIQQLDRVLKMSNEVDPERVRKVTRIMIDQIDTLSNIASAFSDFAKMPPPRLEVFEINQLCQQTYTLFQNSTEEGNIQWSIQLPEKPLLVNADRNQMNRILINLLKNAEQAMPYDRTGEITLSLRSLPGQIQITIEDNGKGIPKEIRRRVFQPNFTTKSSGTGLGLAMCKNMIELMKGRIYFESEENIGTRFYVELPKYKDQEEASQRDPIEEQQ